jgi:uncharacterized protein
MSELLPLFPLRAVLFPGGLLPLRIFEPRYVGLVRDCMRDAHGFGITPIRHGGEAGAPADPHPVGTCAEIIDFDQGRDGLLHILVKGSYRFRLLSHQAARDGLLTGEIEPIVEEGTVPPSKDYAQLKTVLEKVLEIESASTGQTSAVPSDASHTIYRLLERLPFSLTHKLDILAATSLDRQIELCQLALAQLMQQRSD